MPISSTSFSRARSRPAVSPATRRLDIAMRILVAGPGNYAATWLLTALLARTLPGSALSATLIPTLLSFVVFASGVVATFAVRDGRRAALWLAAVVAAAGTALALVGASA